ncbi:hypothetical protein [Paracoccus yeei]|uniref:hypothetical protein n=1 Tax=Paracoccus yeei TaxID=147645 RepID=UPI00174A9874|nr:hypothetical protein [Paracoccus yeei]
MPDPFRLRVMKAVCERLKTITPANGYEADLSNFTDEAGRPAERVFRGRDLFGTNDPKPLLAVLEDPSVPESNNAPMNSPNATNDFKIMIQGFVQDDKFHPLDPAYRLSAEVVKCLAGARDGRFSVLGFGSRAPCIMKMTIGQPIHRPGSDEYSDTGYFLIRVTLTLAEILDDPYGASP